jgi:D-alanyl-D-alanine carboxypeptidase
LKAAQLLERGFNSNSGLSWLMPSLGTVESLQPVDAAPPNLRDEMCGGHRKRPATEDEDEVIGANNNPDSPYGVFLSSLNPPKAKSAAALLQDAKMGEPVLVYTGTKPPAPGSPAAGDAKKKTLAAKPPAGKDAAKDTAKDAPKNGTATAAAPSGEATPAKPKPKPKAPAAMDSSKDGTSAATGDGTAAKPKPKPAPKDTAKDGASPTAAAAGDGAAPKPKPKKPAPKPAATDLTPAAAQQTSQTQQAR